MIIDILHERNYKTKVKIESRDKNLKIDKTKPATSEFEMINGAKMELQKAESASHSIQQSMSRYRDCNDPAEADKLYKSCQGEHEKADRLLKTAKEMLSDERNTLNGTFGFWFLIWDS